MVADNYPVLQMLYPQFVRKEPKLPNGKWFLPAVIIFMILFFCIFRGCANAYTDEQIVNAIYWTEGGAKAKVAYGILSVKVKDKKEARQVCLNTVRNHRKRHANHKCGLDFLSCLAKRYCPVGAGNDPKNLNVNWLKNLKYFLAQKKGLSNG